MIADFEERLFKSKSNLDEIQKLLKHFLKTPLYIRGETRQDSLIIINDKENKVLKRNNKLKNVGLHLQDILKVIFFEFQYIENVRIISLRKINCY